ncbi:34217_t:CDS:2 [Gigaspora margarita]|uniref:34217_t:CDS:1 n=1 Tax=Gigaspora margarita TaxID=4874 RepID=A0ABN7UMD1_GIGMA|nr:34217_t:CDS:2 [Gigaspora margarita]
MLEKRIQIGNSQDKCLVRKINPKLEVLILHDNLQAISLAEDALLSTARYYHYQTKNESKTGFLYYLDIQFFFYIEKNYYKFSIINENYHLKLQWIIYMDDNFKEIKEINSDYSLLKNIWTRINPSTKCSLPQFLRFLDDNNINFLKATAEQINTLIDTENKKEIPSIDIGSQRKKINIHNLNQQISCLKKHIEQLKSEWEQSFEDDNLIEDNLLETSINEAIEFNQLATIGITSQIGKKIYNNYHKLYFLSLITSAKSSTTQALQKCIEYAINQNKEALAIGNANQASGEFICQEMPPEVLNQISPPLEENNLYLDVCVDGNLDSNKTLAHVHIVSKILADLKHLMKNIRNSVLKLRREAKDQFAPSEAETCKMQVDGLIRHLQNNHSSCWSDVCWTKDDPTIIIQNSTLCQINFRQCFELEDTLNIGIIEYEH